MAAAQRGTSRHQAEQAERDAVHRRDVAAVKRSEAEGARQSLRQSLYASDLQLAQAAWESGNVLRMRELLDGQKPRTGEDDLRGFEWHYLRRLGSTVQVSRLAPDPIWGQLSPDGTHYVYGEDRGEGRRRAEIELRLIGCRLGPAGAHDRPLPGRDDEHHIVAVPVQPRQQAFRLHGSHPRRVGPGGLADQGLRVGDRSRPVHARRFRRRTTPRGLRPLG